MQDSWSGKIIVKPIPKGENAKRPWLYYTFARDLDQDGDVDFIGTGEGYKAGDFGWWEYKDSGYTLREFDIADNSNDVMGGHNCELGRRGVVPEGPMTSREHVVDAAAGGSFTVDL